MIGDKIKQLRKNRGLNQKELAKELGIAPSTIAMYEVNKRSPNADKIKKITDYFNVSADYLLNNENKIQPIKEFEMIPILGCISAGVPLMSKENIVDYKKVPAEEVKNGDYFFLEVKGDSMIGARIHEGDLVLVKKQPDVENGNIAVVMTDGEHTIKRVYKNDGQLILQPENSRYEPIIISSGDVKILGRVERVEFEV